LNTNLNIIGVVKITGILNLRGGQRNNAFLSPLVTGFIEWLHKMWIDGKILRTMDDVDRQTVKILGDWEENDRQSTPHIVETGVLGDESWSIEITNPIVERGTDSTSTGMVTGSDAQRLQEDEGDQGRTES
jgi:hypothetical protein